MVQHQNKESYSLRKRKNQVTFVNHIYRVSFVIILFPFCLDFYACSPETTPCGPDLQCFTEETCQIETKERTSIYTCLPNQGTSSFDQPCLNQDNPCHSNKCNSSSLHSSKTDCPKQCKVQQDCPSGFSCVPNTLKQNICITSNSRPDPCQCGQDQAPCTVNGQLDCDLTAGYVCISKGHIDHKATCQKTCDPTLHPCPKGQVCQIQSKSGHRVCTTPPSTGALGTECHLFGKIQCDHDLFCYSRWPNDTSAFCSKPCDPFQANDPCGKGFVCNAPTKRDDVICLPQGSNKIGEICQNNGFLECKSTICISDSSRPGAQPFCSEQCDPQNDECPGAFKCKYFPSERQYFCSPSLAGELGAFCTKAKKETCANQLCIQPHPDSINSVCSIPCKQDQECPNNYRCDQQKQACIPIMGDTKLGDPCNSSQECILGMCATNAQNERFCTQRCFSQTQCPKGFECRHIEFAERFCLPKTKRNNALGEPCPNGPKDCQSSQCISDPMQDRSFCTQSCKKKNDCPDPMICTMLSKEEGFCTPFDYETP